MVVPTRLATLRSDSAQAESAGWRTADTVLPGSAFPAFVARGDFLLRQTVSASGYARSRASKDRSAE